MTAITRRTGAFVLALSILAFAIRVVVANASGIWADEGFFLLVIGAPSWSGMLDFLRFHESHPPLFYLLMRGWSQLTGGGDMAGILLPVAIGALMVPAIYGVGRTLFSQRTGLIAAAFATITPALVEHSSQFRPYGLLPLLALGSCCFMVLAIERGGSRNWTGYVVLSVLMLYTHHWAWVIAVGQQVGAAWYAIRIRPSNLRALAGSWVLAWIVIVVAYIPWASALLFQVRHAGHGSVGARGEGSTVDFFLFALFRIFDTVFPSRTFHKEALAIVSIACAVTAVVFAKSRLRLVPLSSREGTQATSTSPAPSSLGGTGLIAATLVAALALAVAYSPVSNLLFERCLASVVPLALLLFARRVDVEWGRPNSSSTEPLMVALIALFVVNSVFELHALSTRPRSNAREFAEVVNRQKQPGDLLIIAPQWYAASFNHYFKPSIEQVDYPNPGRSGAVDFADVWERTVDPRALEQTKALIEDARKHQRRVWALFGPQYLEKVDSALLAQSYRYREAGPLSVFRVNQIYEQLNHLYGPADTSTAIGHGQAIYDKLHLLLYTPRSADSAMAR
jgi:hypothetical protein